MRENQVSGVVVETIYRVHDLLGVGLLESVYQRVMEKELLKRGLRVERQVDVPVVWDGEELGAGFRADLVVEGVVLVELKSVECLLPVHRMQVVTYLKLSGIRVGLLVNFNCARMREGIVRVVHGAEDLRWEGRA
jgi:GxxExxY protein